MFWCFSGVHAGESGVIMVVRFGPGPVCLRDGIGHFFHGDSVAGASRQHKTLEREMKQLRMALQRAILGRGASLFFAPGNAIIFECMGTGLRCVDFGTSLTMAWLQRVLRLFFVGHVCSSLLPPRYAVAFPGIIRHALEQHNSWDKLAYLERLITARILRVELALYVECDMVVLKWA